MTTANYSVTADGKTVTNVKTGKEVKQTTLQSGYKMVRIEVSKGKWVTQGVHRLVVSQYLNIPLSELEAVNHLNGKRSDNRIENLEACTQSENASIPRFTSKVRDLPKGIHHWRLGKNKFRVSLKHLKKYITAYFKTVEEATAFYVEKFTELHGVNPYTQNQYSVTNLRK